MTVVMDVLWILTMRSVWAGKPLKNATAWKAFDNVRSVTLFLSLINIVLKAVACIFLIPIMRGAKARAPMAASTHY